MIKILDRVNNKELYVLSTDTKFLEGQYLMIDNKYLAEVIEVMNFSSLDNIEKTLNIKITIDNENKQQLFYIAKLSLINYPAFAIDPNSEIRKLNNNEISKYLLNNTKGFLLGQINCTEELYEEIEEQYKNKFKIKNEGEVINQTGIPFFFNYYMLKEYPHIGIFGGSGSGKTFGLRVICEELIKNRIPAIILDPHYEMNFINNENKTIDYEDKYEIFEVGKNCGIKFEEIKTTELISLLEFIGELSQPMKIAIESLHEEGESLTYLINKIEKLKEAFEYENKKYKKKDEELPDDTVMIYYKYKNKVAGIETIQAIQWRLNALDKLNIFNKDVSKIESCMQKRKLAVIRANNYFILKMFSSYLINNLYKKRKKYIENNSDKFPLFFVIIDEAHNFAGKDSSPIKNLLKEISQEARKYGVFLILSTQRPVLLDNTILAQLNTKLIFRTNIKSDMETIKTETNLNDNEFLKLPKLETGNCFVSSAILTKTFFVKIRFAETSSMLNTNPFEELEGYNTNSEIKEFLFEFLPLEIRDLPKIQKEILDKYNKYLQVNEIENILDEMAVEKLIEKEKSLFGVRYFKK